MNQRQSSITALIVAMCSLAAVSGAGMKESFALVGFGTSLQRERLVPRGVGNTSEN
jgi:hypothetical protein